jgi:hypothetical protein
MKTRCYNKNEPAYPRYGGKGVKVCDRWLNSFPAFLEDMGPRPGDDYSLDRIDSNGDYEPSNCRWADSRMQNQNKSNVIYLTIDGLTAPIVVHCRQAGVDPATARWRHHQGWTDHEVIYGRSTLARAALDVLEEITTTTTEPTSHDNNDHALSQRLHGRHPAATP